ncbi:MAG: hypothetical protein PHU85_14415 [Phycisphaerae bacterium]|nr:hypothetical protein [Phycisphaerae bacterium]
MIEFAVDVAGPPQSPGRSSLMAVDLEVRTPAGELLCVPAYCDAPPGGQPAGWRVRFAGAQPGTYTSTLVLTLRGQRADSIPGPTFSIEQQAGQGYIRRAAASRYLQFDDGAAYLPIGQNVCFTSAKARTIPVYPDHDRYVPSRAPDLAWDEAYSRWFSRMAECGANWARLWMGSPDFDLLDGQPWVFNAEHGRRLDRLFELADTHGIHICLCLDYFRTIAEAPEAISTAHFFSARDRAWGRLLLAEGGTRNADLFTTPAIEELLRDLIRYCVARWGYSTRLFAWELWNEIECLIDVSKPEHIEWVRRATHHVRRTDPWRHLVKSSAHVRTSRQFWGHDFGDINDIHMYFGWMGTETAKDLARLVEEYTTEIRGEADPFIVGEMGLAREVNTSEYGLTADLADRDRDGVALHESLWAGVFIGGCGTGMVWWWDEHVDFNDQYWRFKGISRFVRDVPWNKEPFRHVAARTSSMDLRAWELRGKSLRLIWVQSLRFTWWNVIHGARLSPIGGAWLTLEGVEPGGYELEWWNTETGEITATSRATAAGATLRFELPAISKDVALKVRPVGP